MSRAKNVQPKTIIDMSGLFIPNDHIKVLHNLFQHLCGHCISKENTHDNT